MYIYSHIYIYMYNIINETNGLIHVRMFVFCKTKKIFIKYVDPKVKYYINISMIYLYIPFYICILGCSDFES